MTTAEDIFKAAPRGVETFDVKGIPCTLKQMSVSQQFEWTKYNNDHKGNFEKSYSKLISMCCIELQGQDPDSILEKLDPTVVMSMGTKIVELSGFSDDDEEDDKKKD